MILGFILIGMAYIIDDVCKHTVGTPFKLAHGPSKESFHPLRPHHLWWGLLLMAGGLAF